MVRYGDIPPVMFVLICSDLLWTLDNQAGMACSLDEDCFRFLDPEPRKS